MTDQPSSYIKHPIILTILAPKLTFGSKTARLTSLFSKGNILLLPGYKGDQGRTRMRAGFRAPDLSKKPLLPGIQKIESAFR